jgi:hypothetical protein
LRLVADDADHGVADGSGCQVGSLAFAAIFLRAVPLALLTYRSLGGVEELSRV